MNNALWGEIRGLQSSENIYKFVALSRIWLTRKAGGV